MKNSFPIKVYDPKKKKEIKAGVLVVETFVKKVSNKHYMIKEQGWGIQDEVLAILKECGCKNIIIITKTSRYGSLLQQWMNEPVKDYGHGKQRFLSWCKMERIT